MTSSQITRPEVTIDVEIYLVNLVKIHLETRMQRFPLYFPLVESVKFLSEGQIFATYLVFPIYKFNHHWLIMGINLFLSHCSPSYHQYTCGKLYLYLETACIVNSNHCYWLDEIYLQNIFNFLLEEFFIWVDSSCMDIV